MLIATANELLCLYLGKKSHRANINLRNINGKEEEGKHLLIF